MKLLTDRQLVEKAIEAQKNSYAPYSSFNVGAALMTKEGQVFLGCNIENSVFSPTVCAERTAFFKAVSEGHREFLKIAVVGGKDFSHNGLCTPCGVCRQVMKEFCGKDFEIIMYDGKETVKKTLEELLPLAFKL